MLSLRLLFDPTPRACAGGLPLGAGHAQIAEFEYLEDAADASALRRIKFAPGLDFNALVAAVMEGAPAEPAEGQSGAAPGTGREDAAPLQQPPAQQRHVSMAATADNGYSTFGVTVQVPACRCVCGN